MSIVLVEQRLVLQHLSQPHVTLDSPYPLDLVLVLLDSSQVQLIHLVSHVHLTVQLVYQQLIVLNVLLFTLFKLDLALSFVKVLSL